MLDNAAHKSGELRFLPALLIAEFDVDEIEAFERVVFHDSAKEVHAAFFARVTLNCGVGVDDVEFGSVLDDFEVVDWDDSDNGEEGSLGLPALGAAAGVVVGDVAGDLDFDLVGCTVALQRAAIEACAALGQAIVDSGVEIEGRHVFGRLWFSGLYESKREFEGYWGRGVPFFFEELRANLYIVSSLTLSCMDQCQSSGVLQRHTSRNLRALATSSRIEDTGSHPIGQTPSRCEHTKEGMCGSIAAKLPRHPWWRWYVDAEMCLAGSQRNAEESSKELTRE